MTIDFNQNQFVQVTSAGAYYCMAKADDEIARKTIRHCLSEEKSCRLNKAKLSVWFDSSTEKGEQTISHLRKLNWIETIQAQTSTRKGKLEKILPKLLPKLSTQRKALLADAHGLYLSSTGFPHESAEEISALSADLISLHERHQGIINGNLKLTSSNWGLVNAAGQSQLGFWPLHVGNEIFSLVIGGQPLLHHYSFVELARALHFRYAKKK